MKPTVLVVDDKANMLALLSKVLGKVARVVTARGVRSALALLEREAIATVVCDLRMTDGDGLEVLRAVRSRDDRFDAHHELRALPRLRPAELVRALVEGGAELLRPGLHWGLGLRGGPDLDGHRDGLCGHGRCLGREKSGEGEGCEHAASSRAGRPPADARR